MHKELAFLRLVFLKKNSYPLSMIRQLMQEIKESQKEKEVTQVSMTNEPNP